MELTPNERRLRWMSGRAAPAACGTLARSGAPPYKGRARARRAWEIKPS